MTTTYYCADIHNKIKDIEDNSIDFIYTSPPYGTTSNKWDKGLDWEYLFPELWRVLKPNGIIVLYASCPFTYELLQYERPRYHYSWIKNNSTGFFKAKLQPLRKVEEIFVYYKKAGTYNPQMEGDDFRYKEYKKQGSYYGERNNIDKSYIDSSQGHKGRYPTTHKEWKIRRSKPKSGITRCDKQMDYFIKTYSNEGDTILDFACCNGMVGDRCKILNRNYIGIDIEYRENTPSKEEII
jgi:site-specific DNA-methyltransferase (adenine-specific)